MFIQTREELLEHQMKQYNWEQDQIAHMKVSTFNLFCSREFVIDLLFTHVYQTYLVMIKGR